MVHSVADWLFFADSDFSPLAIMGAVCMGAWIHVGYVKLAERRKGD